MNRWSRKRWATSVLTALMMVADVGVRAESPPTPEDDLDLLCGPPPPGHPRKGKRDYRSRDVSKQNQSDWASHEYGHIRPAEEALHSGKLQFGVMNNLHFVLHKVPNHQKALRLLIEWDLAGGRDKDYAAPRCYFVWARSFAPDDIVVWNYGAYYFWRNGDLYRAEQWWRRALELDAENAEVHYNLGLLALQKSDYESARAHARAAYQAGYPLPGLRDALEQAGQWREAPALPEPTGR